MAMKPIYGTDTGVETDMFTGEKKTVVAEGKGKDRQADIFAFGKLQEMKRDAGSLLGDTCTAAGPDMDKEYQFRYRVVELNDIIPSHTTAMAVNPKYTSELQPRVRDRSASRMQVEKIAKGLKPKAVLVDVEALDRGPMIVGPDMMVESGNGRAIALQIAADDYPENFAEYRARLIQISQMYGITPDEVASMKQPVLVRERTTPVNRKEFVAECNQIAVMAMSPYEQAIQDAKNIRDNTLAGLTVSENQSIDQALLSAANRPLVHEFTKSLPNNERAAILDDKGKLNQAGLQRLKAALFAKTYPGEAGRRLTKAFFESLDPTIKNIENGMFASLPSIAKAQGLIAAGERYADLGIAEDLSKSIDMLARLRETDLDPDKYVAQATMLDRELTPTQEQLLLYFNEIGRSPKKIREFIREYGDKVENSPHPKQSAMFGGERVKKEAILERLTGKQFKHDPGTTRDSARLEGPGKGEEGQGEPRKTGTGTIPKPQKAAYPAQLQRGERQVSKITRDPQGISASGGSRSRRKEPKERKEKEKPTQGAQAVVVTMADVEKVQSERSERSRKMDAARSNKNVRSLKNAGPWLNHPDRYDLEGVDTPKRSGAHSGLLRIESKKGTTIKRGRARGKARKSRSVIGMKVIRRRR